MEGQRKRAIKYPIAYDEDNHRVFIGEVMDGSAPRGQFHCPECGEPLRPRAGSRAPHFYHSGNQKCGLESYVHRVAKDIIADRFNDRSKPFTIKVCPQRICEKAETCKLEQDHCECYACESQKEFDLHKHYDLPAEEEIQVIEQQGKQYFVADVLLRSSNPSRKNILIEVYHTHKSSKGKIDSGHRIIEIRIRDLFDLENLKTREFNDKDEDCVFFNFKNLISPQKILEYNKRYVRECDAELPPDDYPECLQPEEVRRKYSPIRRFILYKSGKTYDSGIFTEEQDIHSPSALMDITYHDESSTWKDVLLGVLSKYDSRARLCDLCENCIPKGEGCRKGQNGRTSLSEFNPFKGNQCPLFEWSKWDTTPHLVELFFEEKEKYSIWINPALLNVTSLELSHE